MKIQSQPSTETLEAPRLLALEAREAALKARIDELESNERAYEEIIGKKTYREVALHIEELEAQLKAAEYAARTNYEGWKQEVERNGGSMP